MKKKDRENMKKGQKRGQIIDLSKNKFGRLTPIKYVGRTENFNSLWECKCDCGNIKIIPNSQLIAGVVKSCGCLLKENGKEKRDQAASVFEMKVFSLFEGRLNVVDRYVNSKTKILVKDNLGIIYHSLPSDLLRGRFPSIKSATDKSKAFMLFANKVHGEKYEYQNVEYYDTRKKIIIHCKLHGKFKQKPVDHLRGSGCPVCGLKRTIDNLTTNHVGWSLNKWSKTGINNAGTPMLYIIKMNEGITDFVKIGRTYKGIDNRFKKDDNIPYPFEIVKLLYGDYDFIYKQEKALLSKFKGYKYVPQIKFHGYSECFSSNILELL